MASAHKVGATQNDIALEARANQASHPVAANGGREERDAIPVVISRQLTLRLYTSHFLSTLNSRFFEFGAVLFLASIFPDTLLPMSVYALVRGAAAVLFAQLVGSWIDTGNRLTVVRFSIVGQRAAVSASCGLFAVLEWGKSGLDDRLRTGLFTATVVLACVEKLCSIMNLVSVERDWVVVITQGNEDARRGLNVRMRRIDLLCKLLGPLVISVIAIASTLIAVWTTLAMNLIAILPEYICISQVYKMVPELRRSSQGPDSQRSTQEQEPELTTRTSFRSTKLRSVLTQLKNTAHRTLPITSLPFYLRHPAFLPSFSLSLLYLTVLSFSGQMVTYLISAGYTSLQVGLARTLSSIFELSATWISPFIMKRIGPVRGGIWSLSWQMTWLAVGTSLFFADYRDNREIIPATGLMVCVALSRVGLWGYDLCAQSIVQDEVEKEYRGTFSTVEAAFQNLFELMAYVTTIIFSRPDQFQWPVVISVVVVYFAGGLYTMFVRRRRGHLFHPPTCVCVKSGEICW